MPTRSWVLIENGTIADAATIGAATTAAAAPSGSGWIETTAISPVPQIGWTATQSNGAWTFAAPPTPVPAEVESWQGKIAMSQMPSKANAGKTVLDDANAAIAAAPITYQIAFNAPNWQRNSTMLNALAAQIGLAQSDVDSLFVAAAQVSP